MFHSIIGFLPCNMYYHRIIILYSECPCHISCKHAVPSPYGHCLLPYCIYLLPETSAVNTIIKFKRRGQTGKRRSGGHIAVRVGKNEVGGQKWPPLMEIALY